MTTMTKSRNSKNLDKRQIKEMVRSMLNSRVELKRSVAAFTGLTTSTAGTITPITQGIIQGDTISTRDGNQLIVKKLVVRHNLTINTLVQCSQRVIIFADMQANAAQPVVTDVLDSASFITGFNVSNAQAGRFHILHDEFIVTSLNGSNSGVDHVWTFRLNHKVTFTGTTNVSTANGKGSLFILFIADGANALFGASLEVLFTDS